MYVVVRRYASPAGLADTMVAKQDEVRSLIGGVPGFRAYYAVQTGNGGVMTITVCDDQAGTQETSRRAADWVRTNLAGASIGPPEIHEGETYINF